MKNRKSSEEVREIQEFLHLAADPLRPPVSTLAFEKELGNLFGVDEAVAVSSGTAAIHCALAAIGIGKGDEVLVPSLAVIMSVVPALYQSATPIFVDSQSNRIDFDYDDLERKVSSRSRAILPVYMWGYSYDISRLTSFAERHHLAIVEDACQAHGTRWNNRYLGTFGALGCFSMRDGKLLSTGEGGFVLTNDTDLAQRCRAFRTHWANPTNPRLSYYRVGNNYRITELQALLARQQLRHFDEALLHRQWQAEFIRNSLANCPLLQPYENDYKKEQPNHYSPLFLIHESLIDKGIAKQLSDKGVPNSVGTFGLRSVQNWPIFKSETKVNGVSPLTHNSDQFLDRAIAPLLLPQYAERELTNIADAIGAIIQNNCV